MTGVRRYQRVLFVVLSGMLLTVTSVGTAHAAGEGNFSLQVSPSPLVTTVKPGETRELELKIRNASTAPEELKIQPQSFHFDSLTGDVTLDDKTPPETKDWVSFSAPTFTVQPGEWYTQKVRIALPEETGFSYSFVLVVSRAALPTANTAGHLLNGSVAIFTLINVDRPGATRGLDLTSLTTSQTVYEYLPATFSIKLKNTGNTIIQPYGNLFVSRGGDSTNSPVSTLSVNGSQAYLLPGTEGLIQNSGWYLPLFSNK